MQVVRRSIILITLLALLGAPARAQEAHLVYAPLALWSAAPIASPPAPILPPPAAPQPPARPGGGLALALPLIFGGGAPRPVTPPPPGGDAPGRCVWWWRGERQPDGSVIWEPCP